jgi:hypothetical protein
LVRFTDPDHAKARVEPVAWHGQTDAVRRFINQRAGLREGVAELKQAIEERRELVEAWPSHLAINHATLGQDRGRGPVRAWKAIPRNAIAATTESIRNRLLLFTLELSAGGEGEAAGAPDARLVADAFDAAVVNGTRRGNHGRPVLPGDAHRLMAALLAAGLDQARVADLVQVVAAERPDPPTGRPSAEVARVVVAAVGERTRALREQTNGRVATAIRQYWGA